MCAIRHSESLRLRLASEGKLGNAVRRQAFPHLEKLFERIEPVLWSHDDAFVTGTLDENEQHIRQMSREAERKRQQHQWFSRSLEILEQDKEYAAALAAEAGRKGDREIPESMKPPRQETEMERLYRTIPTAGVGGKPCVEYDAEAPAPWHSRLNLVEKQAEPPSKFGPTLTLSRPNASPSKPAAPTRDVLSQTELAKKLLPENLRPPESGQLRSGSYSLPARRTW